MVQLDPSKFSFTPSIPVLDEGDVVAPRDDGETETVRVDPAFLREIRDNMNRREENTGDLCVLALGHVKRDNGVEETSQAPVIGFAKNWVVAPHKNSGKLALHYDEWLHNEHADAPIKYPRRSPDLWIKRKEIDPVAYLGATTPHRDLGLHPLSMSRKDDTVLRIPYPMAAEKDSKGDAKVEELLKQLVAAVSDLSTKMEALSAGGPQAPGGAGAGEPQMTPEEAEAELQKLLGGEGAQASAPAGGKEKPTQMARVETETEIEVPAVTPVLVPDPEVVELKKKYDDLCIQMARTEVVTKIKEFKASGILIEDEDAEVKDLMSLPPDIRVVQLARIEKSYRRAPGVGINPAVANAAQVGSVDVDAVVKHARTKGTTFEAAHLEIHGKLPGAK